MGKLAEPASAEPLPSGDADLIAASRSGDATAYATLYRRHAAAAHHLARQLVRGPAEADDVVAESFAKVLDLLRRGGGPEGAFRPYLLTAVRSAAYDRHRAERKQVLTDQMEAFDPGVPFADPAVADLERGMIARAFASLPERWQTVLWHTEIEGARPAEVASLLRLTANGVAALAYRAREGLRQAYLQMHLSDAARGECRPVAARLGAYVRGGLAKREAATVAAHLDQCGNCREVFAEFGDVNVALRSIVLSTTVPLGSGNARKGTRGRVTSLGLEVSGPYRFLNNASSPEGKDGGPWIAARCSSTQVTCSRMVLWLYTGRAAVSRSPGTTRGFCSFCPAWPGNGRACRCSAATGTRQPWTAAAPPSRTHWPMCRESSSASRRSAPAGVRAWRPRFTVT
jgi:RNA polymerase sigma factor (sigma-70 family)